MRRLAPDPLRPVNVRTWLVVRNKLSVLEESTEIDTQSDLRAILMAAHAARATAGWQCGPIGKQCGFFFCEKDGERLFVGIEMKEPRGLGQTR